MCHFKFNTTLKNKKMSTMTIEKTGKIKRSYFNDYNEDATFYQEKK